MSYTLSGENVGRQFYARGRLDGTLGGLKERGWGFKDRGRRGGLKRHTERQDGAAFGFCDFAISSVLVLDGWNGTKMRRIR